ncbi:MAG: hypothetical protein OXF79_20290 [Chloroflexi bacterium]|nr:hypothetical protein [Chloroflexota bacterium]
MKLRIVSTLVCCLLAGVATAANAQEERGFYIGFEAGLAADDTLEASVSGVNHPTMCDILLYRDVPGAADPSVFPECNDNTSRLLGTSRHDGGTRFAGSINFGFDFGRLRIEVEHLNRGQKGGTVPTLTSRENPGLASKSAEWSPLDPPSSTVSDSHRRELVANVLWDIENESAWTPYVGLGLEVARANLRYSTRFVRKTLAQGYQDVDPPLTILDRPAAAAGTVSLLDSEFSDYLFGVQVLTGVDRRLRDNMDFMIKARWTQFKDLTTDPTTWLMVRSHEPVRADGVTPSDTVQEFSKPGGIGVTVGLRYRF